MAEQKDFDPMTENEPTEPENGDTIFGQLKSAWQQFDAAGSCVLVQLYKSLQGSQYERVFKDTVALLGPGFACGQSELVLRRFKEIELLLEQQSQQDNGATTKKSNVSKQVFKKSDYLIATNCLTLLKQQSNPHFNLKYAKKTAYFNFKSTKFCSYVKFVDKILSTL